MTYNDQTSSLHLMHKTYDGTYFCEHFPAGSGVPCPECSLAPPIRRFETGATRDTDSGKLDYDGFFSAQVLERRAVYMHDNRVQSDGNLRDGGNWKKGIPRAEYMRSLFRHFVSVWKEMHGIKTKEGLEVAICAAMFNLEGLLFEILKGKGGGI